MNNIIKQYLVKWDYDENPTKNPKFDWQEFIYNFVIISIISLTIKSIIALNVGQTFINLY